MELTAFGQSRTSRWGRHQSVPVHHRSLAPPFPRGPAQPLGRERFVGRRAGQAAFTRAAAEPFPRPSGREKVSLSRRRRRVCPPSGVARRCWGGRSRGLRCASPLPAEAERRVVGGFPEQRRASERPRCQDSSRLMHRLPSFVSRVFLHMFEGRI